MGLDRRCRVERTRGRGLPVDDHRTVVVVDPATPDVQSFGGGLDIDAAEAERALGVLVALQAPGRPGLDLLSSDVSRRRVRRAEERFAHPVETLVRVVEVRLLYGKVRMGHPASGR